MTWDAEFRAQLEKLTSDNGSSNPLGESWADCEILNWYPEDKYRQWSSVTHQLTGVVPVVFGHPNFKGSHSPSNLIPEDPV